jgi:glutamate-1-semialdehyde 2,1-aminomutase
LEDLREECTKEGIILIFDEVVSGFRFHPKGAQFLYNVTPDLSTFGKAMANGFSISALVGKKEFMDLGGLDHEKERIFLLSTTYGGETHHLRAAQKTMEILNANDFEVTKKIWHTGKRIKDGYNELVEELGVSSFTKMEGIDCRPYFVFKNNDIRTLFHQEMIKMGVLAQAIFPSYSHGESEIHQTIEAFKHSLRVCKIAVENNQVNTVLIGDSVKPVFRKYN